MNRDQAKAAQTIEIEGFEELRKALKNLQGAATGPAARQINQLVIDKHIVPPAKINVPNRSGRLGETIRSDATTTFGYILAGLAGPVEYAGVIHFGWSTRGLGSKAKGSTTAARRKSLRAALETDQARNFAGSTLTKRGINKAARQSIGNAKTGVGAARGGPIRPQPFIYDAIDSRSSAVFEEYDRQYEQRMRIEGLL